MVRIQWWKHFGNDRQSATHPREHEFGTSRRRHCCHLHLAATPRPSRRHHVLLGVVAGLVGITASCHIVDPLESILIGAVASALCIFASESLTRFKIDDVVGAWPTHAVAGMWGTLAVALFGDASAFAPGITRLDQVGIQLLGIGSCAVWSFGIGFLLLRLIDRLVPFRVSQADELAGLNVSEHQATTELIDLLSDMNAQTHTGDFEKRVRVEPHTEVGQIAQQYNAVLSRVQAEMEKRDSVAEALRQAEQRYRRIFEDAVEGIFQTTPQGRYLIANPALARIYGYESPGELIESVSDISTQIYTDESRRGEFHRQMELHGSVTGFESEIRRKDGSTGWISESARAVRDEVGNILYYEGTVEDISQQRLTRRMQQEIEVAQHASQAKSTFLAHVSHEIRTPLNGIIGMLDLLQQSTLDDSQANYVRVARSSSKLLLSVINDVLDFSKIEAGKLETSPHDFNIVRWVEEIIESFAPTAEKKGLTLNYDLPPALETRWHADADRLKQIATNLIGNSIKFTERGSVSFKISIIEEDQESALIRFSVRDTGIGIPSDRLSRLFQPFSQVDASTTRKYGGTGLGLAISRKLAELLGGELAVSSQEGVGSEFFWTARLRKIPSIESATRQIPAQLQSKRAMVISSVPTDGDVLSSYLQRWGIECERTDDISSAIVRIGAHQADQSIDLVLIDDALFGIDPSQVIGKLRLAARPPMVMSLVPLGKIAASSQRSIDGLAGYITRPIIQSRLFDALINAFDQNRDTSTSNKSLVPASVPKSTSAKFGGRSVLVAEDNEVNQFVIKEILQRQGFVVTLAATGRQAADEVQRQSFDLVLMDCQMPEMDGFQATQAIRDWEKSIGSAPLPIIALTASAIRGDRERCIEAGMNDYITKPLTGIA